MTAVWAAQIGSHTEKLVLLALADNANDEGECYPSLTLIAQKCEAHRSTIKRALNSLECAGHISRERRQHQSTLYRVHPAQVEPRRTESLGAQSPRGRRIEHPPVGAERAQGRRTVRPITVIEPSIEPSVNRQGTRARPKSESPSSEEPPPSNLNVEAWHRWEQYRKQIRKPIHPASKPSAQRKLADFGADQAAVVEQSIANGWQGLFELKARGNGLLQPLPPQRTWRPSPEDDVPQREDLC